MSTEFVAPIGRHCLITPLVASVTVPDAVMGVHIDDLGPNQANTASSSPGILVCVALRILMHFERFRSLGSRGQLVSGKRPTGYARKQVSTAKHRLLGLGTANCPGPSSSKSTHSGGKPVSNQPRINDILLLGRGDKLSGRDSLHLHAKPCYGFESPDQMCPHKAPKHAETDSDLAARHVSFSSEISSGQWFDDACRGCTVQIRDSTVHCNQRSPTPPPLDEDLLAIPGAP
ncbi:uncharacterized protein BDZ83DRAFT_759525 [Colletotrichum acutatum]|uniref:Uncharacterized protein n=1 Tax=Glomerella acutata TaxID=27357 RepID=A0AAD9D3N2_GLOAC|nr:uncharacterized protein BDZ83DRAFT_759525 [Colletotrichum acutatum]KAK1731875.1 hypothetical protein BDZ83DRAFT_759525 [Colletotrichum acutatum]